MKGISIKRFECYLLYLLSIHVAALFIFFIFRFTLFCSIDYQFPAEIKGDVLLQSGAFLRGGKEFPRGEKKLSEQVWDFFDSIGGKESFIKWEKEQHGWEVRRDWIRFAPGVVTGIFWCMHMLTKPGDAAIINMPVYYPFHHAIEDIDRKLIYSELVNTGGTYTIDFGDFEKKIIDNDVKVFILCSPHNPVGRVWTEDELRGLLEICQKHHVTVISDEIHHDLIIGNRPHIPTAAIDGLPIRLSCFGIISVSVRQFSPVSFLP